MPDQESLEARAGEAMARAIERHDARIAGISPEAKALRDWDKLKVIPSEEMKQRILRRIAEDRPGLVQELRELREAFLDQFREAAAELEGR